MQDEPATCRAEGSYDQEEGEEEPVVLPKPRHEPDSDEDDGFLQHPEKLYGLDPRPLFPLGFASFLIVSSMMTRLQSATLQEALGDWHHWHAMHAFFWAYFVTLYALFHVATCNPGTLDTWQKGDPKPARCKRHWFYDRPVLRLNHYCRWVTNCIGLKNHREFMLMLTGVFLITILDTIADGICIPAHLLIEHWTFIGQGV